MITKELMEKAKTAKTAEELAEMAKAEGLEMSDEAVESAFADLNRAGELSDNELDNVSGGGCGGESKKGDGPKFKVGDKVYYSSITPGKSLMSARKVDAEVLEVIVKDSDIYYKVTGGVYKMEHELRSR